MFNLFFKSAGAEGGHCDFAYCADADPAHGVYSFMDALECLGGAQGKIGVRLLNVFSYFAPRVNQHVFWYDCAPPLHYSSALQYVASSSACAPRKIQADRGVSRAYSIVR
jgi:hypothetical protein